MIKRKHFFWVVMLAGALALAASVQALGQTSSRSKGPPKEEVTRGRRMKFTHVCIISKNLNKLRDFYQDILQIQPDQFKEDYVEFPTEGAILSLFSLESHEKLAPGSMQGAANRSVELEFQVEDVDQEYARLKRLNYPIQWIMPPTTLPWGNRSIYFRDPDGNFINFYSLLGSQ